LRDPQTIINGKTRAQFNQVWNLFKIKKNL